MTAPTHSEPVLFRGGLAIDDRGELGFVNDFRFEAVKRFYTVANHRAGFVRAWHGHRKEGKYVTVVEGAALIGAVPLGDGSHPSRETPVKRYVLSANQPSVLFIPPGYFNGFMSLTADTKLMFFSTATLEESLDDDIRLEAHFWNIWNIEER
jgi:dTDP-4-dehydrorhamnose 3,5-epimerase-like enzyme